MNELQIITHNNERVLTTARLAEQYGTEESVIRKNFANNKNRYTEGKHYYCLSGKALSDFFARVNFTLANQSKIRTLYLWTEKGALLHAKSLNTDKAWEVYDYLVDFYFRAKEKPTPEKTALVPVADTTEPSKAHPQTVLTKGGFDIAPAFRELISLLPVEALDEMEKCFRNEKSMVIKLAATSILAEKMKRQLL